MVYFPAEGAHMPGHEPGAREVTLPKSAQRAGALVDFDLMALPLDIQMDVEYLREQALAALRLPRSVHVEFNGVNVFTQEVTVLGTLEELTEVAHDYGMEVEEFEETCVLAGRAKRAADLQDGEEFSPDSGQTWYVAAVPLFGNVAVYADERRDEDAPTYRVDVSEIVHVRP